MLPRPRLRRARGLGLGLGLGLAAIVGVMVATVASGATGPAGAPVANAAAAARTAAAGAPVLRPLGATHVVVPGPAPRLAWPHKGESAVGVQGIGLLARSPDQVPVPIASLTKLMTAYVVLRDHPLGAGEAGPEVAVTGWAVADWHRVVAEDGSNVRVEQGEHLSERQLLEALLLSSGDNIADLLAAWDAGSQVAFVAKMNADARALGLHATHYVDASGLEAGSRSDAVDQEALAARLMQNRVVRRLVRRHGAVLPVAGRVPNYNPALGVDGIVGLKSGYTSAAGGCLATAAWRRVGTHRVLVASVALGQPHALQGAARAAEHVLSQATRTLEPVRVAASNEPVGNLTLPWSPTALAVRTPAGDRTVVGWPGLALTRQLVPYGVGALAAAAPHPATTSPATAPASASGTTPSTSGVTGTTGAVAGALGPGGAPFAPRVGTLEVRAAAGIVSSVALVADGPLPALPPTWRAPTGAGARRDQGRGAA